MRAVDDPVVLDGQLVGEVQQQVVAGHEPTGEEVPRHPIAATTDVEGVGDLTVAEDVHEELAAGSQPRRDAAQQLLVVAHVLEHLDRDHAVERRAGDDIGRGLGLAQDVDVAGQDPDVVEAPLSRPLEDLLTLRGAVGHRRDPRVRVVLGHPQRQRAPAAAELEHVLAVLQLGALAGQAQHRGLGLGQRLHATRPQRRGVLQVRSEHQLEEPCRHLVVLLVGLVGVDRDWRVAQRLDQLPLALAATLGAALALLGQPLGQQRPDRAAQQRVGQQPAVDDLVDELGGQRDLVHRGARHQATPSRRVGWPAPSTSRRCTWVSDSSACSAS